MAISPVYIPDSNGNYFLVTAEAAGAGVFLTPATSEPGGFNDGSYRTYKVNDALELAKKLAKGVPFSGIDLTICDMVNSTIWKAYPWRGTMSVIPLGTYPLVDGQQDYALGGITMMRPTQFWIMRTDVTPDQGRSIGVAKNLAVDLMKKSPFAIRSASLQAGVQKLRLESAPSVPTGTTFELLGEYQPHPTKITDLQDSFWFTDEYLEVFVKGLIYWAYRLADDSRAGAAQKVSGGRIAYTGALAEFMDAIDQMAAQEDFGDIDGYYPDDTLGAVDGRRYYSNEFFPLL
jgi:hypothetical protein